MVTAREKLGGRAVARPPIVTRCGASRGDLLVALELHLLRREPRGGERADVAPARLHDRAARLDAPKNALFVMMTSFPLPLVPRESW